MGIKRYKPTTPTLRYRTVSDFANITKSTPEKSLLKNLNRKAGRGAGGRISMRRRGGGHKRFYRVIDFKRDKIGIDGKVTAIEYDPNRNARIALITYVDGEKRYIIAPDKLVVGEKIVSSPQADIKVGNTLPLANIPVGTFIHNVEIQRGKGARIARAAGTICQLVAKEHDYCHVKLPSSEIRLIRKECFATIGEVGNKEHKEIIIGKAGRNRWLGKRPKVRGVAMNPVDHPMGGGEGKSSGGRHPVSPWGLPAKGKKTRKKSKPSNKLIVRRRKK